MNALSDRIRHILDVSGLNATELAKAAGVTRATVSMWMSEEIKSIKLDYALKIGEATGFDPLWIVLGKGEPRMADHDKAKSEQSDFVPVRKVMFKISAGIAGFAVDYVDNGDGKPVFLPKQWLEKRDLRPEQLYAIEVKGESMTPSLREGDIAVVDTGDVQRRDGEVYAVNFEGELTVKRLIRDSSRWWLASDNPDQIRFGRKMCDEGTYLLGRIVYKQSEYI
ncbi:helix-turn-helix domain-containing protein [Schauerella aestuarii]|uniref:helix-turn-helix domain-containing protein n=1 Tax=Schauerella aestuarii TaxID=2511204 RepID=UPI00136E4F1B|nr:S24 family peptidase [Achromobacter aestuarii]MYZ44189.1 helix-turn-helix transcriptional regulator [Achromobacter aestuarii]